MHCFCSVSLSLVRKKSWRAPDFKRQSELLKRQDHDLDKWILTEYTNPYNIEGIWRGHHRAAYSRNYIPPKEANVKPYLMILKGTFIKTYEEVMGKSFIKPLIPKQFHLLGEWGYNSNGTITLGQAETGSKFTFYGVNHWSEKDATGDYPWIRKQYIQCSTSLVISCTRIRSLAKTLRRSPKRATPLIGTMRAISLLVSRVHLQLLYAQSLRRLCESLIAFYTTLTPEQWDKHINEGGSSC